MPLGDMSKMADEECEQLKRELAQEKQLQLAMSEQVAGD